MPLLVRLPAHSFGGQLTDRFAMSIDVGPTLAELGLHQEWTTVRGESLAPVLRTGKRVRSALFAEGLVVTEDGDRFYGYAMSSDVGKLISDLGGSRATVTMRTKDPAERDLIALTPGDFKSLWAGGQSWWTGCAKP